MKLLRVAWRLLRAGIHVMRGYLTIRIVFPRLAQAERDARVQAWARRMLELVDIRLVVVGASPVRGPVLLVANHISWLDILVMHAARHCRFVSKADIERWPVVGVLSTGTGTLYIERTSRRDAMRVVHRMVESLGKGGDILAVFPEGTTSDGKGLLPFHANLVQAAITADAPIQPVGLQFLDDATGAYSGAPNYVGDDSLGESIWRTLSAPRLRAVVSYGVPQMSLGRDRRAWAHDLRDAVEALRKP